ncbi:MAG: NAD-dependent epimerase/dehydratase family protein [Candidatus Vogelbacteria bacterium]|nr:NAD-dependent epimerase/dehydratase family protein [Candidatus Vogelbacteria bacterium]
MKKKILICGSTGFIGRNTAESFAQDDTYEVFGTYFNSKPLTNPRIKMVKVDLTSNEALRQAVEGKDIVIQAAAATSGARETFTKPYYHVTDNAVMNALLFRAAFDFNVQHLIFLSCTTMYQSSDFPIKESDFDANQEIYSKYFGGAWTKVYNENMCKFYSRLGQTKFTVIRHSNIYGPYDKYDLERSHVFGATITKVMTAKEVDKIVVWGKGSETRDLLYVEDLVDCFKAAINKQTAKFELVNAGQGVAISVNELVAKIVKISGKNLMIEHDLSQPTIPTKICLDISRVKTLFNWQPQTCLADGIKKTIVWYQEHNKELAC